MIFSSIKTKLTCAVFVMIAVIMSVTTFAALLYFEGKFREKISQDQFALLNAVATQIDDRIFDALVDLDTTADSLTPAMVASPAMAQQFLDARKDLLDFYDNSILLFSSSGRLLAANPRELNFIGKDFSFRDYIGETLRTGKICLSAPFYSMQKHSQLVIVFTAPVYDGKGQITAVLGGAVNLTRQHYLRSIASLKLGSNGFLSLYDSSRIILMHPDNNRLLQVDQAGGKSLVEMALQDYEGTEETVMYDGTPVLRSVKKLKSTDWVLAISYPLADAYASIHAARIYFLAGGIAAALLSVLVVWPLMKYLTMPLLNFTRHLERLPMLEGENRLFQSPTEDEIGIMARAFNDMMKELERRKAALKEQKEFAESLVLNSSLPTFVIDADHKLLFWNKACEELTGVKSDEIIGSDNHWTGFFDRKTSLLADLLVDGNCESLPLQQMVCNRSKLVADGWRCEGWYDQPNGRKRYVILDSAPIRNDSGKTIAVIETVQDITELKQAEQALRESEERYRQLFENNPHPMWAYDLETLAFLTVNNAAVLHYGYSRDEFLAMTIKDIRPPEDVLPLLENVARVTEGIDYAGVWRHTTKDGSAIFVEITSHTMLFGGRSAEIVLAHDVTERKRAEESLVKLSQAIEQSPVSVVITNAEGIIEYANPKKAQLYGYEPGEALGRHAVILDQESNPAEESDRIRSIVSAGNPWCGVFRNRRKSGELFWGNATVSPVKIRGQGISHYIIFEEDITERKTLEEQLQQSQKMEAIGTLVGGIAHDFNNILTAIIGYATLTQQKLDKESTCSEYVGQILEAGERAARLTQSLLAYSRKQISNPVAVDLNVVVKGSERLLRRLIPECIAFTISLHNSPLIVMADSWQIDQILMNLIANARDAISGTGELRISTEIVEFEDALTVVKDNCRSGRYSLLTVADTGMGMDEKTRERIFEPFFTTKEVGRGTGLGLSIVYGIVKQHNGFISCQSEPGGGTIFRIYFPLINEAVQHTVTATHQGFAQGDETILLVEDDENVRKMTKSLLEEAGYKVIVAVDGQDAVVKFTEHHNELKLTILDVVIPKMGGMDVCRMIFELSLDAKVLFVSGYTADITPGNLLINERCAFLPKPINPGKLLDKIREILDKT